jgi:thiol:disulfide interchange protein DsbD
MRRPVLLTALVWLSVGVAFAQGADKDLLPPEQAFQLQATPTEQGVRLEWTIADGYYLYRSKFRFRTEDAEVTPGPASFPAGKLKPDDFFGPMEIYRHKVAVDLPLLRAAGVESATLRVTSQGCADMGVCYPPRTQTVAVELPPPSAPAGASPAARPLSALTRLGKSLGGLDGGREFLEPDQAFRFSAKAVDADTVLASWDIADGYYLYKDKFKFRLKDPENATLGAARLPPGKVKEDPLFGKAEVYYHRVEVPIAVSRAAPVPTIVLEAGYQGCAEGGICYPPITRTVSLTLPPARGGSAPVPPATTALAPAATTPSAAASAQPLAEQDRLARFLLSESLWVPILAFFGAGLLLAFTPCVFPMIPILSGIIVGQGSQVTTRKAFVLSVTYVLAMSVTYTVAGMVAGLFGKNLQAALQNAWMLGTFSAIFVLLALSMFGFYSLQIPSSWQAKLTELSNRQQGGTLIGVAMMGLLSALIVGPCVAPPLAAALIVIGESGDPVRGGLALFALSLGMGAPLVVVGTLEGRLLPKAGGWMNAVKGVFGVLLLGVAIYLLDRVLPRWITLLLWAGLFIVSAIYMGALEPLGKDSSGFRKLWKGVGLVMLVYGVLLMIGSASGSGDMFQPLRGVTIMGRGPGEASREFGFRPVKGPTGLARELALASASGKPVVLDFYADWCAECKRIERTTFSDPRVQRALSGAVLLRADVTANDGEDQALLQAYRLIGPPAILFFGRDGEERRPYRLIGFLGADEFREHAARALN